MWFSDYADGVIGEVTTAGAVTVFPAGVKKGPIGLASSDDSVYFLSNDIGYGVVASNGQSTPYSLICHHPTCAFPYVSQIDSSDLAITNDGGAWMSGDATLNSQGQYEYVLLRAVNGSVTNVFEAPGYIPSVALGPDGAVWFIDQTNTALGRIDASGDVSEISLAAFKKGGGGLGTLAAGPDGNIWVTTPFASCGSPIDYASCTLRVTPQGTITGFNGFFNGEHDNNDFISGPDKALWSGSGAGGLLQRIDIDGDMSVYSDPGVSPSSVPVTVGPDKNIWTAGNSNIYSYDSSRIITAKPAQLISRSTGTAKIKVAEATYTGSFDGSMLYEGAGCGFKGKQTGKSFTIRYDSGARCVFAFEDKQKIGTVFVTVLPAPYRTVRAGVHQIGRSHRVNEPQI